MRPVFALTALPLALALPAVVPRDELPHYIVVLKPEVSIDTAIGGLVRRVSGIDKTHTYELGDFKGFSAPLSGEQLTAVQSDPNVAYVEEDGVVTTLDVNVPDAQITQSGATWGLARISHASRGSTDYVYDSTAGEGTCSYIVDTGINADHVEFEGRATFVANLARGSNAKTDDQGHGTHVSGTIGAKTYGVAKKTLLYGIKVLDSQGRGTNADVIAGINKAASDSATRSCPNGVVVNMSLGGGKTQALNDAVAAAVDQGLFFAVAAGNDAEDYHSSSPASEPKAFAVGASDKNDAIASFSNFGAGLGAFAPGVGVLSTWIGSNTATRSISGTSMASPHTAGLAAYLLGLGGKVSPAELRTKIQGLATKGQITGIPDRSTPNLLAYNGIA
jgi:subtilisin family serine protease